MLEKGHYYVIGVFSTIFLFLVMAFVGRWIENRKILKISPLQEGGSNND